MKKYLKCIKKLPLAKSILGCLIFISSLSYSFASDSYSLDGQVTHFSWGSNFCNFSLERDQQPGIKIYNQNVCNFISQAKDFNQKVTVIMTTDDIENLDSEVTLNSVSFLNKNSSWFGNKNDMQEAYSLEGNVENIFYKAANDRCYVAINDSSNSKIKYNNKFHETDSKQICQLAADAFYLGLKVKMQANLDPVTGYSNDINSLTIDSSCSK